MYWCWTPETMRIVQLEDEEMAIYQAGHEPNIVFKAELVMDS